jgi:hypothetical protein
MTAPRHLSWSDFARTIMVPGEQRMHRLSLEPDVGVFWDGSVPRLGLRIALSPDEKLPGSLTQLSALKADKVEIDNTHYLELSIRSESIRKEFYAFAGAVADSIVRGRANPIQAVVDEISGFGHLLQQKAVLSVERQIGLTGELLVLRRIIVNRGRANLAAWVGPRGEPHDFRMEQNEFEVKTSVGTRRIHTINSLDQLTPSQYCELHVVSILLGPPGKNAGVSLQGLVKEMRGLFDGTSELREFENQLSTAGYREADAEQYTREYMLRKPLRVIQVSSEFPRIDRDIIATALGPVAARIEDVSYQVNLEGLGSDETEATFPDVLRAEAETAV